MTLNSQAKISVDFLVVGGGIVGLLTAISLKRKYPLAEIVLIEKMPFLGDHSTGRNSGVLHSGLYYETNSLKHRLCLEGLSSWKELAKKFSIEIHNCGKIVFATSNQEIPHLEVLREQGSRNGVNTIMMSRNLKSRHADHIHIEEGLFIPSTSIIDVPTALKKLADYFENQGGIIQREVELLNISKINQEFAVMTSKYSLNTKNLINCGGLWATQIRTLLNFEKLTHKWVKGHYLRTSQNLSYKFLYYPLPPADLKGLGVHSTIDLTGKVKFGPDTLDVNQISYDMSNLNFEEMKREITKRFKNIDPKKLLLDYAGIRSKILWEEKLHKDFWIKGPQETKMPGYAEACGIESPGLTSSPAIASLMASYF